MRTKKQIEKMFEKMGLLKEEDREKYLRLQSLGEEKEPESENKCFYRLDNITNKEGDDYAGLAPDEQRAS